MFSHSHSGGASIERAGGRAAENSAPQPLCAARVRRGVPRIQIALNAVGDPRRAGARFADGGGHLEPRADTSPRAAGSMRVEVGQPRLGACRGSSAQAAEAQGAGGVRSLRCARVHRGEGRGTDVGPSLRAVSSEPRWTSGCATARGDAGVAFGYIQLLARAVPCARVDETKTASEVTDDHEPLRGVRTMRRRSPGSPEPCSLYNGEASRRKQSWGDQGRAHS